MGQRSSLEQSTRLWLVAVLSGCVHAGTEGGPGGAPAPVSAPEVEQDLARIAALDVIEVAGIDPRAQPEQLSALADVAEEAVREPVSCEGIDAEAQVQALLELRIVDGVSLVTEEAQPEPNCYNLPCPDEVQRVEQRNCERVGKLASIVAASRDL